MTMMRGDDDDVALRVLPKGVVVVVFIKGEDSDDFWPPLLFVVLVVFVLSWSRCWFGTLPVVVVLGGPIPFWLCVAPFVKVA